MAGIRIVASMRRKLLLAGCGFYLAICSLMLLVFGFVDTLGPRSWVPVLVAGAGFVLLLVVAMAELLHRAILAPTRVLAEASRRIAAGDYTARMRVRSNDELAVLAESLNRIADRLASEAAAEEPSSDIEENALGDRLADRDVATATADAEPLVNDAPDPQELFHALSLANRRLMEGMEGGLRLQLSLLPAAKTLGRVLGDHFVIWRPKSTVSGDMYFFRAGKAGFLLGVFDCTGHGVSGALVAMTANAALNFAAETVSDSDPAKILQTVSRLVRAAHHYHADQYLGDAQQTFTIIDNGLDMALCYCEPEKRRLTFAGAKLPLLYVMGDEVLELSGDRQSLGYKHSRLHFEFTNHEIDAQGATCFYLLSDGIADQRGGEKGLGFGTKRVKELVRAHHALPLAEQGARFEQAVTEYQGAQEQRDDITWIGFNLSGSNARASIDSASRFSAGRLERSQKSP